MRVALVGYGAMGQLVEKKLVDAGHVVAGVVSLGMLDDLNQITSPFDVIIDFSHPSYLDMILTYVKQHNTPLVVATTGYTQEQIEAILDCAKHHPVVYTANFSLGITVFEEVLKQITPILEESFDIEVIEKHHNKKVDAPSGTAKMLVNAINQDKRYEEVNGRVGMSKRGKEIGIHAVRGGTIVGEHSVIFAGEDEVFEIKHEAHSKNIFVNGAIKAASFIVGKDAGLYNMNDVLFSK